MIFEVDTSNIVCQQYSNIMQFQVSNIPQDQISKIVLVQEGQFSDVKAIEIAPAKLTNTISAFANTDGGDLYVGIDELGEEKRRIWRGFADPEAANSHIQTFEPLFPLGMEFNYEFLVCDAFPGHVLHIQVNKTKGIKNASSGVPYIRRGAQNLPANSPEMHKRLEYLKGISSFESEPVNAPKEIVVSSPVLQEFIKEVVPKAEPEAWLKKQMFLVDDRPSVAGVLLFSEEPQAALPKRCGIKVYQYKTSETEGLREELVFDPKTVEGCLYDQIKAAVALTTEIIENIPKLGDEALEKIKYPNETLHEIITNAVIHRDYSIGDDVHIRVFENRIEVQSPGRLPAHITPVNILTERAARNGAIVRILNKFKDAPNKDVGEGLNTAFEAMHSLGLKEPIISERGNSVLVTIKHETLASPEEAIMAYLEKHQTIRNAQARKVAHVRADYQMKSIFGRMVDKGLIEQVPGTRTSSTAYRKKHDSTEVQSEML